MVRGLSCSWQRSVQGPAVVFGANDPTTMPRGHCRQALRR
jgi:hypothetical protein